MKLGGECMSYYYNYYIGYSHDGKICPLGPYDAFGKLRCVLSRSRSFASDLHEDFRDVPEGMISDELRKEFEYENWEGRKEIDVRFLEYENLPGDDFIRKGYFLIEDVAEYEKEHDSEGLFYDCLSPTVYHAKAANEMKFGRPGPLKDCEGEEYIPKAAADYMYYSYPDYRSKEYEVFLIKTVADILFESGWKMPEGSKIVILETEG